MHLAAVGAQELSKHLVHVPGLSDLRNRRTDDLVRQDVANVLYFRQQQSCPRVENLRSGLAQFQVA